MALVLIIFLFLFIVYPFILIKWIREQVFSGDRKRHEGFLQLKEAEYEQGLDILWDLGIICNLLIYLFIYLFVCLFVCLSVYYLNTFYSIIEPDLTKSFDYLNYNP